MRPEATIQGRGLREEVPSWGRARARRSAIVDPKPSAASGRFPAGLSLRRMTQSCLSFERAAYFALYRERVLGLASAPTIIYPKLADYDAFAQEPRGTA